MRGRGAWSLKGLAAALLCLLATACAQTTGGSTGVAPPTGPVASRLLALEHSHDLPAVDQFLTLVLVKPYQSARSQALFHAVLDTGFTVTTPAQAAAEPPGSLNLFFILLDHASARADAEKGDADARCYISRACGDADVLAPVVARYYRQVEADRLINALHNPAAGVDLGGRGPFLLTVRGRRDGSLNAEALLVADLSKVHQRTFGLVVDRYRDTVDGSRPWSTESVLTLRTRLASGLAHLDDVARLVFTVIGEAHALF